jgi:adenylate cyclase
MRFAIDLFKRAIDLDSNFALAWATLADCSSALIHYYSETSSELRELCDDASLKALELAPQSSEAHASRGFALSAMGQLSAARQEFETALAIDPNQSDARYYYGRVLFQQGAFADAIRHFEYSCETAENHEARFFAGQSYEALKRHAEAATNYRKALAAVDKHLALNPDDARAMTIKAVSLFRTGSREDGLVWAGNALDADSEDAGVQYNVACLFALENQSDRAIEALKKALDAGFGNFEWFEKDPDLDSLRGDPRFKALFKDRWPASK